MYLLEFLIGLFIGIVLITCLLMLISLLAADKRNRLVAVDNAGGTILSVMPEPERKPEAFFITRQEIAENTRKLENPDITVAEYSDQPQLPTTLKYKGKTYTMLYGTDKGVLMIVRIADSYADELAGKYPVIRRASFPNAPNWYCFPLEGTLENKEEVYRILFRARTFLNPKSGKTSAEPAGGTA